MRIVLIIQARMGSSRLPGKVLKQLGGKPLLAHMIERLQGARVDEIVLATTDKCEDDAVAALGEQLGVRVFRGSETDVLDRYYQAAKEAGAKVVVRVTGDCPMHEGRVIDAVISQFFATGVEYLSGPVDSPEGLDTEVFSFPALERAWREAQLPSEREHVTLYFKNHPELFRLGGSWAKGGADNSSLHLSVDTPEDFSFAEAVFGELGPRFQFEEVLELVRRKPELRALNAGNTGFEGLQKSLSEDAEWLFARSQTIAIVGCGSIGARHARNLKQLGVERLLLCDQDTARAEVLAREVEGTVCLDYADALSRTPNAVVIATPSSMHVAQAREAAERGVAIFMEKPLATSREGLEQLLRVVEERQVLSMMGQSYRWHEGLVALKKYIDVGSIGKIRSVEYYFGTYLPDWHPEKDYRTEYAARRILGGGVLFTNMSHTFDTLEWLFGKIQKLTGALARFGDLEIDVDDTAEIRAETEAGVRIHAVNDFLAKPPVHTVTVLGEQGTLVADFIAHTISLPTGTLAYSFAPNARYVAEMQHFLRLLRSKAQSAELDLAHGSHIVELMTNPAIQDLTRNRAILILASQIRETAQGWIIEEGEGPGDTVGPTYGSFRVAAAVVLAATMPDAKVIASGFAPFTHGPTIAQVVRETLLSYGVSSERIEVWNEVRKTAQEIEAVKKLVAAGCAATVITNEWHLPRVQAMLEHFQVVGVRSVSAEEVLLTHDKAVWAERIQHMRQDPRIQERIAHEQQGVDDMRQGRYRWP